jgi:hypothetical protein
MFDFIQEIEDLSHVNQGRKRERESGLEYKNKSKQLKFEPLFAGFPCYQETKKKEFDFQSLNEESPSESTFFFEDFFEDTSNLSFEESILPGVFEDDFVSSILGMNEDEDSSLLEDTFSNKQKSIEIKMPNNSKKIEIEIQEPLIQQSYSEDILRKKRVLDLRLIAENVSFFTKLHYHWTWLQKKADLINLILDPFNLVYIKKKYE